MEIDCQACGQRLRVADDSKATAIRCSRCKAITKLNVNNATQAASANASNPVAATKTPVAPKPTGATKPPLPQISQNAASSAPTPAKKQIACLGCQKQLALPSGFTVGKIKCPHCMTIVAVGTPASGAANTGQRSPSSPGIKPAAPRPASQPASPRPAMASSGSSFFDDLPSPAMPSSLAQPAGFGSPGVASGSFGATLNPYASSASAASSRPVAMPSYAAPSTGMSATGPAVLLMVQSIFTILICVGALAMLVFAATQENRDPNLNVWIVVNAVVTVLSLAYQGVILGGAIQMVRGRVSTFGKAACILAIIPLTFLTQGFCFGFFLYPLALGGGIWGMIALGSRSTSGASYAASPVAQPASHSPAMMTPYSSMASAAASQRDDDSTSRPLAVLMMVGGVLMIAASIGIAGVVVYSLTADEGDRPRKIGRGITGAITLFIGGISLTARGFQGFRS